MFNIGLCFLFCINVGKIDSDKEIQVMLSFAIKAYIF